MCLLFKNLTNFNGCLIKTTYLYYVNNIVYMNKKIIISIIFILILTIGLFFIFIPSDDPNIIEDDELSEEDVIHNFNEQKSLIDSYSITKDMTLSNESNTIQLQSDRIYHNELNDAYVDTELQYNTDVYNIEKYIFSNTKYTYDENNSEWNVQQENIDNSQLFDYENILSNDGDYNFEHNEEENVYIFTIDNAQSLDKTIDIWDLSIKESEKDKFEDKDVLSASNVEYKVKIDDENFFLTELEITSNANVNNSQYNLDIHYTDIDVDVAEISLPEALTSQDNIESQSNFRVVNISTTTEGNVQFEIVEEDISDTVNEIRIESQYSTVIMDGNLGEVVTLESGTDFDANAPFIQMYAEMNNGDTIRVAEYKLSDIIEEESDDEPDED